MKLNQKIDEAQKQLETLEQKSFDKLDFSWEGIDFHAASITKSGDNHSIHLKATLGRLYFTVEDKNQRAMALERLFTNNRQVDGNYQIGKKGDIRFENHTKTKSHLAGTEFMVALTIILLDCETHLRALQAHLKPNYVETYEPMRKSA